MGLHPSFKEFLSDFQSNPDFYELTPNQNREILKDVFKVPPYSGKLADIVTEDRNIQLKETSLPLRIYRSKTPTSSSLIWFHGGGFLFGDLDSSDPTCRLITAKTNRTVISVGYRLAPEFPFPIPPEDCFLASKWIVDHANELNISTEKMAIGGASAGATLATVVCLMWRDKQGWPSFEHQLLIMPMVDHSLNYPSYEIFGTNHCLTTKSIQYFLNHYTKQTVDLQDPYCLPINAKDLTNLPPATLMVAECDPLHDEGVCYANLLKKAGNAIKLLDLPGLIHGFIGQAKNNPFAEAALNHIIEEFCLLSDHVATKLC